MKLLTLALVAVSACQRLETTIERGAEDALPAGQSAGNVPIGALLGHRDGAICIVLGELNDVSFSDAVPPQLHARIIRQLDAGPEGHMSVKVHLFDGDGRRADAISTHWRNARVFIDTPDGSPDLDACFAPNDTVFVEKVEARSVTVVIYSLPDV